MTDIIVLKKDYAEFISSSSTIHLDLQKVLKFDYNGKYKIHIIEDDYPKSKVNNSKVENTISDLDKGIDDD
jgi:hypothetical protein